MIHTVNNSKAAERNGAQSRTDIFKFRKNGLNNLILAVRGVGACARVYSMNVYYYYCEERDFNGFLLPNTTSPYEGWKRVEANCSADSSPPDQVRTLSGYCGYNGTWNIEKNLGCFCKEGLEKNKLKECSPCPDRHFKATSSNDTCKQCPSKSINTKDRTSCECMKGYYHFNKTVDPTKAPCFGPVTEKIELLIQHVRKKSAVRVTWNGVKVENELMRKSLNYDVQCFVCENDSCKEAAAKYKPGKENLTTESVEISNLHPNLKYVVRVYPKTAINNFIEPQNWTYSESKEFSLKFSPPKPSSPASPTKKATKSKRRPIGRKSYFDYVVVSGIASGVLFMIMVVLLIIVVKRKTEYRRHLLLQNDHQVISVTVELPHVGQKLYVDPTNYDSPEDALNDFACELDPSALVLEKLIGGGEFGDVYKGIMKRDEGKATIVAVKILKTDHTAKNEKDFMLEASVMGQFHDPNVIHLEGVITKSFPRMIVTEYMSNGSLDRFLRLNDDQLTDLQLIGMGRGVASGMAYLSSMNFIHRDLAARNILVDDDLLCKITDFGLSRSLGNEGSGGEYATSGGKIPVRWTAPEAIAYRKFSTSSDIWSFGILLWEIMSFGDRPYWEWDNIKVMNEVEEGFRLPAPKDCPTAVHSLMLSCWRTDRNKRPKFEKITQIMNGWIRSPETMNEDLPNLSTIGDWLHSIKMGDYTSNFLGAGYESPCQLTGIGNDDLLKIGVKLIGHRNKILKAVNAKAKASKESNEKNKRTRIDSIVV
ncbi:ephrin type-A receptor 7-like [Dendronephthya gigantea]|uniref:ephrin type-A receptor 7-like n=1 Tax=Dendronephthya gigantea TaxID=151771 RepID=UPI00106A3759|nr:ephrin type-A receptor 7-like [Dendronephthya gigantea]